MIPIRDSTFREGTPYVTRALIAINVVVWLVTAYVLSDFQEFKTNFTLGAVPEFITGYLEGDTRFQDAAERHGINVLGGALILVTPLTAMFLHGGFFHLGGNMLFLWVFGDNIEDRLGRGRFLVFYFLGGYLAAAAHIYLGSGDLVPMIGASGGISAVLGAYILLYPRALVQVLIPVILLIPAVVPAALMIGFWFLLNIVPGVDSVLAQGNGSGTAWWAHIGGFAAGILLIYPFLVGRWRAPAQEVTPTWNTPFGFGFRFGGARRHIPPQGRLRSDPPPRPPPDPMGSDAGSPDADASGIFALPDDWHVVAPSDAPKRRRRIPRFRRRGSRPGSVDAFRRPPRPGDPPS